MTRERAPYSRVYWSVMHDEKFDTIRADMRLLGSWLLMLMLADMAYPAPTFVPPTVSRRSLRALVDADLVALLPGKMYRVCGLAAERERRQGEQINGGVVRASSAERDQHGRFLATTAGSTAGTTAGDPADQLSKDETRRDETSLDTARESDDDPVVQYAALAGGFPSKKAADWIDDLTRTYGTDETIKALAAARKDGASGIIGRAQGILRANARDLSKKEQAAEEKKVQARRVDGMLARRLEWHENTGKWDPTWGPEPGAAA